MILDEPTRGVDVGARAEIYALMNRLTSAGLAILMISSDLPELLGMADRIVVMREGRMTGEVERAAPRPKRVMALAMRRMTDPPLALALRDLHRARRRVRVLALATDSFFTVDNLSNVLRQNAFTAIIAAGMTFVILTAGIDLSVGSVVGLVGRAVRGCARARLGPVRRAPASGSCVGLLVGAINGLIVTRMRVPPFIVTLAMMLVVRGAALKYTERAHDLRPAGVICAPQPARIDRRR